jgi:ABC-type glutathione transport system ATPase component
MALQKNGLSVDTMNFAFSQEAPLFFKDVSFSCDAGKIHFLQGQNGSGKSTLFKILQGNNDIGTQLTGSFSLNGVLVNTADNCLNMHFTKEVKTVVQHVSEMLADQFSVEENMQCANFPMYPGLRRLPAAQELSIMYDFGIDKRKKVHELSGGQRQILAILMALQQPAQLLLLDEPTAALDPKNAHMVMRCLQELAQQLAITIVIISHDKELVSTYASGSYLEIKQDDVGMRSVHRVNV